MLPIFVYGTLKSGRGNYRHYLTGNVQSIKTATTPGTLYSWGAFPMMVQEGDGTVWGELMDIHPHCYEEVMAALDRLEGVNSGFYSRVQVDVTLNSGFVARAWAYVGTPEQVNGRKVVATGEW